MFIPHQPVNARTQELTTALRATLAPDAALTVGLVGSISWSEPLQRCYGWELVELLHLVRAYPTVY